MRSSKDAVVASTVRRLLNTRFGPIGEVISASLDTAHCQAHLRVALRGESEPIDLEIRRYRLKRTAEGNWLTVVEAASSRQWLAAALSQFVVGRRLQISNSTAAMLRLLA